MGRAGSRPKRQEDTDIMLPQRIAITGATGFIGSRLVERLEAAGSEVVALSRDPVAAARRFPASRFGRVTVAGYDAMEAGSLVAPLAGAEAVVHLAGAPIATRWTPQVRAAIRTSREQGTRALVTAIGAQPAPPRVLLSASAVRYYGISDSVRFSEASPPGPAGDYLTDVTHVWEAEAQAAAGHGVRVVVLRFGLALAVTDSGRGTLSRLKRFLGGRIGSGRQWVSWIHREDAVEIMLRALSDAGMQGAYNAVAPHPVRMSQVTDAFGRVGGSLIRVPVPEFVLREYLGDGATVVLDGQRVHPDRLEAEGFDWRFPRIGAAVHDIMS